MYFKAIFELYLAKNLPYAAIFFILNWPYFDPSLADFFSSYLFYAAFRLTASKQVVKFSSIAHGSRKKRKFALY